MYIFDSLGKSHVFPAADFFLKILYFFAMSNVSMHDDKKKSNLKVLILMKLNNVSMRSHINKFWNVYFGFSREIPSLSGSGLFPKNIVLLRHEQRTHDDKINSNLKVLILMKLNYVSMRSHINKLWNLYFGFSREIPSLSGSGLFPENIVLLLRHEQRTHDNKINSNLKVLILMKLNNVSMRSNINTLWNVYFGFSREIPHLSSSGLLYYNMSIF